MRAARIEGLIPLEMLGKAFKRLAGVSALALAVAGHSATARADVQSAGPAAAGDVRLTFERPVVYAGKSHLAWVKPYAFIERRGVALGLLLRVTNASSAPVFIAGLDRDSLSLAVETQQSGAWQALPLAACETGIKPLRVAGGQSFELQVPLPEGAHTLRVSIAYRTVDEPDAQKGSWLTAYSDAIDVHRWSTTRHGRERAAAREAAPAPPIAPAAPLPPGVWLTFERPTVYSGRIDELWTTSYAFVQKRGSAVGALLRLTNATSTPLSILGFSRDALSIRVEVRGRNEWRPLLIGEPSVGLKPLPIAAGESIELQVPLPDDAKNMRVSIVYRTSNDPDWTTGGWQTVYSDSIDVRRVKNK